ncbi:MAG: ribosome-associated translation inhibitor RaiA [Saprospiraceae bacterium]|nr:ribosome-associated translation inhibitor RaiA [Saprospiraceae bacterium]
MNIQINSVKFKVDKKLKAFIEEKVEKLSSLYDGVFKSEITLRIENNDNLENKFAEIRLHIPGYDLFAKKQCKTFEESVDTASEALRKQLIKHKQKIRNPK